MSADQTAMPAGAVVPGRRRFLASGTAAAAALATAAALLPEGDGYLAALTNFRFIANGVWRTAETLDRLPRSRG